MRRILLAVAFLFSFSLSCYSQSPCGPGEAPCGPEHTCVPVSDCGGGPPPPGLVLPIDTNIYYLMAAGLVLGVYFFKFSGKVKALPTSNNL